MFVAFGFDVLMTNIYLQAIKSVQDIQTLMQWTTEHGYNDFAAKMFELVCEEYRYRNHLFTLRDIDSCRNNYFLGLWNRIA